MAATQHSPTRGFAIERSAATSMATRRITAEALLRRQDREGLRIVAEAMFSADFQHRTHIHQAVTAVLWSCDALSLEVSTQVREGAVELREMLAQIEPLLYPQNPA